MEHINTCQKKPIVTWEEGLYSKQSRQLWHLMRLQEYNVSRKTNTDTTSAILETHLLRCLAVCQSLGSPADSRYGSRSQRSSPAVNQSLQAQCNKSSKLNDKICCWPMPSRTTHRNSSRNLSKSFAKVKVCEKLPLCPTVNSTATN